MDAKKGSRQSRISNGSKRRSSNFNFFRKSNNGVSSLSEPWQSRPESRYGSLKSNNNDLAKALEKSCQREAELKEQISGLQNDNLDLMTKLQDVKEKQEHNKLDNIYQKRLFINRLIDAIDLLVKATVFCENEERTGFIDWTNYRVEKERSCDAEERESTDFQFSRDDFVTVRNSQSFQDIPTDDSIMAIIKQNGKDDAIFEENALQEKCQIESDSFITGQSVDALSGDIDDCLEEMNPKKIRTTSECGSHGSMSITYDVHLEDAEGNNAVVKDTDDMVITETGSVKTANSKRYSDYTLKNKNNEIEQKDTIKARKRTFEILDESVDNKFSQSGELTMKMKSVNMSNVGPGICLRERVLNSQSSTVDLEKLSKKDRRNQVRKQRKERRSKVRMSKMNAVRNNDFAQKEKLNVREMPSISRGDKENVDPRSVENQPKRRKLVEKLHRQGLCCSPVASVVKRMFSPMRTKSPFVRRKPRARKQISYAEPSLAKKLRQGDPCTDSSMYSSPLKRFKKGINPSSYQKQNYPMVGAAIREEI